MDFRVEVLVEANSVFNRKKRAKRIDNKVLNIKNIT